MSKGRIVAVLVGAVCLSPALAVAQTVLTQKNVPIRITKSGSYILGGNLKVTDPTVGAIVVAASDVTIDLGGFTIEGPPNGPTSNGTAIETGPQCCDSVVVKNGHIHGFAAGVSLTGGHGHRVEGVHVHHCGGLAIYADGVVTRCEVTESGSGIGVGQGSVVSDNLLRRNAYLGIHTNTPGATPEGITAGAATIVRNTIESIQGPFGGICIRSPGANRIEENTCHGGVGGLVLTNGANFYARNFIYGAVEPLVDAGPPNIDGGTIDPALSNVIVPVTP